MRPILSVLVAVAIFVAATTASATVTITLVGTVLTGADAGTHHTYLARDGDIVQIDIFVTNDSVIADATFTAGIDGGDFGVGSNTLNFLGGSSAATWFNSDLSMYGAPEGGAVNGAGTDNGTDGIYTSIAIPRTLDASAISFNGNIVFFSASSVDVTGDGSFDMGILDGSSGPGGTAGMGLTSAGAAHARLIFQLVGSFYGWLSVGDNNPDDLLTPGAGGSVGILPNSILIGTPEPGTALLMGLGLSGLSLTARRRG